MPHLSPLTSHLSPRPAAWLHNPALSLWLSVDPLSDKYPGVSPYAYCANNPVRLVDVDGREIWHPNGEGNLVADKGDNAYTLAEYLNTSPECSKKMLAEQGYTIDNQGKLNLKDGDIFEVDYGHTTQNKDDLEKIGNLIRNQASLGIAQDLFSTFWQNGDDWELNGKQFAGILLFLKDNPNSIKNKGTVKLKGNLGKMYDGYKNEVSFYSSPSYALAFGTATVYTNTSGNVIGFYDFYNFDSQPFGRGNRSILNEIKTRMVNNAARLAGNNHAIHIRYGYSQRSN